MNVLHGIFFYAVTGRQDVVEQAKGIEKMSMLGAGSGATEGGFN